MRLPPVLVAATAALVLSGLGVRAAEPASSAPGGEATAIRSLPWQQGPATAVVGTRSKLVLPKGSAFLGEASGSRFLEMTGNLPSPGSSILAGRNDWWAVLAFDDIGYVKDDEKIDADALLKSIREGDRSENEERRRRGLTEIHTEGWFVPPHYDPATHHLEWGVKLRSDDSPEPIVNYSVRLLGRSGVENVVLVSSPEALDANVAELRSVLKTFDFDQGGRYSEFKPGDHVAEIGLGALVLGGAAAVATKTGFWKLLLGGLAAFWKVIAGGIAAVVALVGKLLGRKKGGE